MGAEIAKYAQR